MLSCRPVGSSRRLGRTKGSPLATAPKLFGRFDVLQMMSRPAQGFGSGVAILAAAAMLLASALVQAQSMDVGGMQGLSTVERHRLRSDSLETTYTVLIRIPESVTEGAEGAERLPVVYLLDGGATFPALAGYYRYLFWGRELPELTVVGISYGTSDSRNGNQRGRDFTAPSSEREFWGGVGPFLDFVESEVFPLVESRVPVDAGRRVLFGQSLGGQAVIWAALNRPGMFWGHIASNPALHRNLEAFLVAPSPVPASSKSPSPRPRIFVSSASDDETRFREPAVRWMEHWSSVPHSWTLSTRTLEGHGHFSALPLAFREGLRWLFADP